ncbi:MAG: hypothetical protein DCC49_09320 [Acidobacteria bacterium]|nr:MAG: hypothetical protein DCC49_09320 [Acidobacteriota bacterium]
MLALTSCQSPEAPNSEDNELRATIVALQATVEAASQPPRSTEVPRPTAKTAEEPQPASAPAPEVLEVGEAATEDGFSLRLVKAETNLGIGGGGINGIGPGIKLLFDLTNNSTDNLPVGYGQENFEASDNLDNRLDFGWAHNENGLLRPVPAQQAMLDSGSTIRLPWGDSRSAIFYVSCDITDPEITDVFVTIQSLGRISLATFRVRVPH